MLTHIRQHNELKDYNSFFIYEEKEGKKTQHCCIWACQVNWLFKYNVKLNKLPDHHSVKLHTMERIYFIGDISIQMDGMEMKIKMKFL